MNDDIRWKQRFNNFEKGFSQLKEALDIYKKREPTDLEKQGIIQSFEYTYELAWNMIRDYLIYQGENNIMGSRDAIKLAYKYSIIKNADIWIEMLNSRNLTVYTYNEKIAEKILVDIIEKYFTEFESLFIYFKGLK